MSDSAGQVTATTLAAWLNATLTGGIKAFDRWVEPTVHKQTRAITITTVGPRRRLDVKRYPSSRKTTTISNTQVQMVVAIGDIIQELQIEIWCKNDVDRQDTIFQLDTALNSGTGLSLGDPFTDDPWSDGLLLQIPDNPSGFVGFVDYDFEGPELYNGDDANQRGEYRATYLGEARSELQQNRVVSKMTQQTLSLVVSELSIGDTSIPPDITNQTVKGPTILKVTPASAPHAGGTLVVIQGTWFQSGAAVMFGSTPALGVSFINKCFLSCSSPAGTAGTTVPVTVTNPDGSTVTALNAFSFT